jgi:hypothetical protein
MSLVFPLWRLHSDNAYSLQAKKHKLCQSGVGVGMTHFSLAFVGFVGLVEFLHGTGIAVDG